jgi:hypothetical protein
LDDGGWGAIATNFANALAPDPSKRAHMMLYGAQYQKILLEQEEKRRQMEALQKSIEGFPATLPTEPMLPKVEGQDQFGPPTPQMTRDFGVQRNQRIADNAAATLLARSAEDFAKGVHGNRAMGAIAGGIPAGTGPQDVIQTQLSAIGASLPNYSTTPHTYQPLSPGGEAMGPAISSRRIPEGPSTMVSPGKAGPANVFENDAAMDQALLGLARKAQTNNISVPELEQASVLLANRYGVKNVQGKGADGATTNTLVREREPPEVLGGLLAKVGEYNSWNSAREESARTGRPMPPLVTPAAPVPPVGGLAGAPAALPAPAAAAPGAAPGAAAPAPIVPPPATVGGLPVGANVSTPTRIAAGDASPLRKEWMDHPAVKKYEQAILPYQQFSENVKVGTATADISLIYNLAKMLDPESVVREGEMLIWQKTGGALDRLQGLYDKIVSSRAALPPQTRANLADTAERVMTETHKNYERAADRFGTIAGKMGIDPELIVPKVDPLPKIDRKAISSITPAGAGPRGAPERSSLTTAAPARPPGGGRTIRVNPDTGAIEEVR